MRLCCITDQNPVRSVYWSPRNIETDMNNIEAMGRTHIVRCVLRPRITQLRDCPRLGSVIATVDGSGGIGHLHLLELPHNTQVTQ